MNNYYNFKWQLDERGFKEIPIAEYSATQIDKMIYVNDYLSPSIKAAECGWHHCVYYVFENKSIGKEEFVALYPEKENENGRFYNVSCNSKGAISEQIWYGVFK